MVYPAITACYAAIMAAILIALSIWVMAARLRHNVLVGDGGLESLSRRIGAHGNFTQYVPMALILLALLEAGGAGHGTLHTLLIVLLLGRIVHPFGMVAGEGSLQQYAFRAGGILATLLVIAVTALLLLARLL